MRRAQLVQGTSLTAAIFDGLPSSAEAEAVYTFLTMTAATEEPDLKVKSFLFAHLSRHSRGVFCLRAARSIQCRFGEQARDGYASLYRIIIRGQGGGRTRFSLPARDYF